MDKEDDLLVSFDRYIDQFENRMLLDVFACNERKKEKQQEKDQRKDKEKHIHPILRNQQEILNQYFDKQKLDQSVVSVLYDDRERSYRRSEGFQNKIKNQKNKSKKQHHKKKIKKQQNRWIEDSIQQLENQLTQRNILFFISGLCISYLIFKQN